ncbi:MAG: prolipoprotein diacylglyceryl transferase [Planctomycetota bacterium]
MIDVLPMLAAWVHDLDPYIFRLPDSMGGWGPRWYGFAYLLGFAAGYFLILRVAKVGAGGLRPEQVVDWATYAGVGLLVGGRLGYCIFYEPALFGLLEPMAFPYWGVLAVNRGGMASHGGIIGAIVGCVIFAWRNGLPPLYTVDLVAFAGPPGVVFGRVANFINGELYGRPVEASFALAVRFPQEMQQNAAVSDRVVDAVYRAGLAVPESAQQSLAHFHAWVLQRVQAGDGLVRAAIAPALTPRHPSQLYAALGEGLLLFVVLALIWVRPRRPGVIVGWFMISYAVVRIGGEFFRMPDAHLGLQWLELSRGQWLSVPMLLVGVGLLAWSRRAAEGVGGWRRGPWTRLDGGDASDAPAAS